MRKKVKKRLSKKLARVTKLTWAFRDSPDILTTVVGGGGGGGSDGKVKGEYKVKTKQEGSDTINHPEHYTSHPSGVECIQITEHMNFNLGNAIKYIWRHDKKAGVDDLRKAAWYIQREMERLAFQELKA